MRQVLCTGSELWKESWKASFSGKKSTGNKDPGLTGFSQGTETQNFFIQEPQPGKENSISKLINDNGNLQDSGEGMARVIKTYFSNLFCSSKPFSREIAKATDAIGSRLNGEMITDLNRAFSVDEIKRAIFEMNPTKAPGPDGFHAIFFHKFWNVVGVEISKVCLQVLNGGTSITEFNHTNVILIPKIQNPTSLKDFRPISLCIVIYKTMTKVLANRLKSCITSIISPSQSAFVPGRQIFDNVVASFEILHSISRMKSGKRGLMALKLDISKAYDRVE
ncbi:hypothetical protein Dsin_005573 [Dipteronia sinensis]|uniref:Reverse transcriptase domain-containing protein n=1 Tax=Dipteronia sinensis TaxID=43782 RepID=A0AAE0EEU2_9ROSI|nr:hypothetical protein Dsin_005573 [Dipteronia sinensis]